MCTRALGDQLTAQHQVIAEPPHIDPAESQSLGQLGDTEVADDLFETSVVSDETWEILARHYSTEQLMDAVFTVGQYNLVSWALNSFGVPLDDFLPGAKR